MDNKMKSYLGSDYTDNSIINFLNYWMRPTRPRETNDLDCLYRGGSLDADTIFSVWTPLKFVLDYLNPDEKFYKKDYYGSDINGFLIKIKRNIDKYLPKDRNIVKELYKFVEMAETEANVLQWLKGKESIKPLIKDMKPNESKWLKEENEIIEMLQNYTYILKERLKQL